MVMAVHDRKIDWAVGGISASIRRGNITDFTRYIHTEGYTIAYGIREDHLQNIEEFFFVLGWVIYVLCFVVIILISFLAAVGMSITSGNFWEHWGQFIRVTINKL